MFSPNPDVPHEMKVLYIERRKGDLVECEKALLNQDFAFLQKIGHQVKGSAVSYGFDALSPIALDLETAAELKDTLQLHLILKQFSSIVQSLDNGSLISFPRQGPA